MVHACRAYRACNPSLSHDACRVRQVDALAAPVPGTNATATLQDVCYKPLGDDCATQSILQVALGPYHLTKGITVHGYPREVFCKPLSP